MKVILFLSFTLSLFFPSISFANYQYEIGIVKSASTVNKAFLGGRIVSSAVVNLTSQLSGDIITVNGIEGSYFKKGDDIIKIESDSIKAKRDSAVAEVSSAVEVLKNAKVRYSQSIVSPNSNQMFGGAFNAFTDPMNQMFGNSNPNFDKFANRTEKFTGVRQAENRVKQAQAKLKEIEEQLSDSIIKAPFDGVVVNKKVNVGDVVLVGQSLVKFSNLKQLQVEVNVPSRLMNSLRIGSSYRIKIDTLPNPVMAKLSQVYPMANDVQHSVKVKLNLPLNLPVLPGIYAELELTSKSGKKPPTIPISSVLWRSSLPSVFVVNKFNKTELRFIRVGQKVDADTVEVLTGLKIGQRIITNPNIYTTSGSSI